MPNPIDKARSPYGRGFSPESPQNQSATQLNNLIDAFRILTAKLDADVGVTDTNYAALVTQSATAPAKLV